MDEYMLKNSLQDHKIITIMYQRGKEIITEGYKNNEINRKRHRSILLFKASG